MGGVNGGELSIVGFDGVKLGRILHPILTTMEQDSAEKGRRAVKELLSLIKVSSSIFSSKVEKEGRRRGDSEREDMEEDCAEKEYNDADRAEREFIYKDIRLPAKLFIGETVAKLK